MKVILLKNIPGVGKQFEVKEVADGHALNMLFPKKLAEAATPKAIARIEKTRSQFESEKKVREDLTSKNLKALEAVTVTISKTANEKGHLFAGIDAPEIASAIKEQTQLDIHPDFIDLPKHIKEVGEHAVSVAVHDQSASFTLVVTAA